MRSIRPAPIAAIALILALAVGCQKKAETPPPAATTPAPVPFKVVSMDLGKSLTEEKKVTAPATTFGVRDTIYLSVASEGESKGTTLKARWTFQDSLLVAEDSQQLAPNGPAQTEFHVLKPTPWPKGPYAVEVSVDGVSSGRKTFTVQ